MNLLIHRMWVKNVLDWWHNTKTCYNKIIVCESEVDVKISLKNGQTLNVNQFKTEAVTEHYTDHYTDFKERKR